MSHTIVIGDRYCLCMQAGTVAGSKKSEHPISEANVEIIVDRLWQYLNVSHLLREYPVSPLDWLRSSSSHRVMHNAANDTGMPVNQLVKLVGSDISVWHKVRADRKIASTWTPINLVCETVSYDLIGGIYFHPYLLASLARFVSTDFTRTCKAILDSHAPHCREALHWWSRTTIAAQLSALAAIDPPDDPGHVTMPRDLVSYFDGTKWTVVTLSCWWQAGIDTLQQIRDTHPTATCACLILMIIDPSDLESARMACEAFDIELQCQQCVS